MFKRITTILFIIVYLFTYNKNLKANDNYIINYYFDNILSDNTYYYEVDSNNYPIFEGYTFKDEVRIENYINLYYETTKINVIIKGNGGLYNDLEELIVKTINYGDTYTHNPLEINSYIFTKEGYTLESFERNFERSIIAKEDIIYYANWIKDEIEYTFIINNEIFTIKQKIDDYINLPIITDTKNFLGFFDNLGNKYDSKHIIKDDNNLTLYAKFENDQLYNAYSEEIIFYNTNLNEYFLEINGELIYGEQINNDLIFKNLKSNNEYKFINQNNEVIIIKTTNTLHKNHYLININDTLYILNNNYYTYYNDLGLIINDNLILYNDNITYKIKYLNDLPKLLLIENSIVLNEYNNTYEFTNYTFKLNDNDINNLYLLNNYFETNDNNNLSIPNVIINSEYYLIIESNDNYYYINYYLNPNDIVLKIFNNKVIVINNSGYLYKFNNYEYYDLERTFDSLQENKRYFIEYKKDEVLIKLYFYTNNLKSNLTITDFDISVLDSSIIINNPYKNYVYGLIKKDIPITNIKWKDIVDKKVIFNNLDVNTNYDLYIKDPNDNYYLIGTIKTLKRSSDRVTPPKPKIEIINIIENKIEIKNNPLIEYSIDKINWFSSNNEIVTLTHLNQYTSYDLYIRYKETENENHSNEIKVYVFKTLIEKPSEKSLINFYYDYHSISFDLIEGYNYYFNNNLITGESFYIDNLEINSSHTIVIERITDKFKYEYNIKLKTVSSLSSIEKNIKYYKTHNQLVIENSNDQFKYIIKNDDTIVNIKRGNDSKLIFELNSDKIYQIYVLKDSNDENFYIEEFIISIYIPNNLQDKLNDYLINNKYKNHEKISNIINDALLESYKVNSKQELERLYEQTIIKLDEKITELTKINNKQKISIVSSITVITISLIVLIYIKRKKVKS